MESTPRRPQRAATLIELVAVVAIIALLAGVFGERLSTYFERAEKAAMEQVVVVLRSALQLRAAGLIAHGRIGEIKRLESDNPMDWLSDRPENYLGVFAGAPPADRSPGKWYFDGRTKTLVYVPQRTRYFVPGEDGKTAVRFRVRIDVGPFPGEEGKPNPIQGVSRMEFAATEPYKWFSEPN